MKKDCLNCGKENPKPGMKTCCRKCADELKKINSREKRKCLFCNKEFSIRKKDTRKLCSEECREKWAKIPENLENRINLSKIATKEKFGVDNVFQLENVKEKSKKTKKLKYGDESYNNSEKMINTKKEKYGDGYLAESIKIVREGLMKKYGADHPLKIQKFKDKKDSTNLKKYGVENIFQLEEFKQKRTNTIKKKYGVENASQSEEVKEKKRQTSINNFGVSHHLKDYKMFQKHLKAQYKMLKYKNSEIYYQGSYELHFLEKMDAIGLLNEIENGKSYDYVHEDQNHVYHTDFFFKNSNIEIKSGWTYNKNGKDKLLEDINNAKWKSVVDAGDKIIVLMSKREIDLFVELIYNSMPS